MSSTSHPDEDPTTHERLYSGLPFTNEEVFEANAFIYPRESLEAFWHEIDPPPQELTRMAIAESVVLLLAAMSAEYADRIVRHYPDLKPQVDRVREAPELYIESERERIAEYFERGAE